MSLANERAVIGGNIPPEEISQEQADEIAAALEQAWGIEIPKAMPVLTVKGLKPYERLIAQRNALLRSLIRQARRDKSVSAAPAIMALMSALSDNDYGRATISNERLARVLGRDKTSIERCIKGLVSGGYIVREVRPGTGAATWLPMVRFDLATKPVEMVNSLAPSSDMQDRLSQQVPASATGTSNELPAPTTGTSQQLPASGTGTVPAPATGSSNSGTRADDMRYPRSARQVPAPALYNDVEFIEKAGTTTTLTTTAKYSKAGAQARTATDLPDEEYTSEFSDWCAGMREVNRHLLPTITGKPVTDFAVILHLARMMANEGLKPDDESYPQKLLALSVGVAVQGWPSLTYGELADAASRSLLMLAMAERQVRELFDLFRAMPENGVVATSVGAIEFAAAQLQVSEPLEPNLTDPDCPF